MRYPTSVTLGSIRYTLAKVDLAVAIYRSEDTDAFITLWPNGDARLRARRWQCRGTWLEHSGVLDLRPATTDGWLHYD